MEIDTDQIESVYTNSATIAKKIFDAMRAANIDEVTADGVVLNVQAFGSGENSWAWVGIGDEGHGDRSGNLLNASPETAAERSFSVSKHAASLVDVEEFLAAAPSLARAVVARVDSATAASESAAAEVAEAFANLPEAR